MNLDLPLIWAAIIAVAIGLYVLLDGFDLGVGMWFPFARSDADRDVMMNTIAPVWDGNETWLVLGGGGLFAAFPLAYAILLPALYLPVMLMLAGLILRGVAFEFRLRGRRHGRTLWTSAFALGSTLATVAQGFVLGGFIQGVTVRDGVFAGGPFDWLTPYTMLVAAGLVCGYALLGAGWLTFKTQDELHGDARRWSGWALAAVAVLLALVSVATLVVHPQVAARWGVGRATATAELSHRLVLGLIDAPRFLIHAPVPLIGLAGLLLAGWGLRRRSHLLPFVGAALVFVSGFLGLAVGFAPYAVPGALTFRQAAAADNALSLLLIGTAALLPLILVYTGFVYWTFRGKVTPDAGYH